MKLTNFARILAISLALSAYSAWTTHVRTAGRPRALPASSEEVAGIRLIRRAEAEAMWHKSSTVFLDVRSGPDYDFGHIAGAVHVPDDDPDRRLAEMKPRLERAEAIVVYCKSVDCGKSLWAAIRLHQLGLRQAMIYPEGWNEWTTRGLPTAGSGR